MHTDTSWILQQIPLGHRRLHLLSSGFGSDPVYMMNESKKQSLNSIFTNNISFSLPFLFIFFFRSDPEELEVNNLKVIPPSKKKKPNPNKLKKQKEKRT